MQDLPFFALVMRLLQDQTGWNVREKNVMYDSSSDVAVHVEIKDYSIAYFDHIATFEALYC